MREASENESIIARRAFDELLALEDSPRLGMWVLIHDTCEQLVRDSRLDVVCRTVLGSDRDELSQAKLRLQNCQHVRTVVNAASTGREIESGELRELLYGYIFEQIRSTEANLRNEFLVALNDAIKKRFSSKLVV